MTRSKSSRKHGSGKRRTKANRTRRKGSLVIVGSGIKSIAQLTLEGLAYIEQADKVFYSVAEMSTATFIKSKNAASVDLSDLYREGKDRNITYIQMAERMLAAVRQGHQVVGVFYGHPGMFVDPSHRAIAVARSEGYHATMLPGVSAEGCLFADLRIDPSTSGYQMFEATDLLLRDRPLNPSSHLVIFQAGVIGETDFVPRKTRVENAKLRLLLDKLETVYKPRHRIFSYEAARISIAEPVWRKWTIKELRVPANARTISNGTALYVPPASERETAKEMVIALGLSPDAPSYRDRYGRLKKSQVAYDDFAREAVKALKTHRAPASYRRLSASTALVRVLSRLGKDPIAAKRFRAKPHELFDG